MNNEVDRLLNELADFREKRGSVGPLHPRFKRWLLAVRSHLGRRGVDKPIKKLERLRLARTGGEMWQHADPTPSDFRDFLTELDEVAALLEEARERDAFDGEPALQSHAWGANAGGEPLTPGISTDARGENAMDHKVEPGSDGLQQQWASSSARAQVMEKLLGDLGAELKSPEGDLENIQRVMADLLELKKTGQLLEQLRTEAVRPEARWESIRETMSQLWTINRETVIELMPTLLKTS